jgi:hypothetical protein
MTDDFNMDELNIEIEDSITAEIYVNLYNRNSLSEQEGGFSAFDMCTDEDVAEECIPGGDDMETLEEINERLQVYAKENR